MDLFRICPAFYKGSRGLRVVLEAMGQQHHQARGAIVQMPPCRSNAWILLRLPLLLGCKIPESSMRLIWKHETAKEGMEPAKFALICGSKVSGGTRVSFQVSFFRKKRVELQLSSIR